MKREIKFRALREDHSQFEYGTYAHMVNYPDSEMSHTIQPNGWKIDHETLGEFTGIKDKNGVDVYDGDVILIHWSAGSDVPEIVSYDEKYAYWKYGNNPICELIPDSTCDGYKFDVIGNIYQNPELLTINK